MSLFGRREEPLHERLLREAELDVDPVPASTEEPEPLPPFGFRDELHGPQRPREWDVVATVTAPGLRGSELDFVVLEDGSVLMEDALPQGSLEPLCNAVEAGVARPYRARAVLQGAQLWAVSARNIELVELTVDGNELELTVTRTGRRLVVDGEERDGAVPELELGSGLPAEFHATAIRVEGRRWEIDVVPL